jgi:hypothetical protein
MQRFLESLLLLPLLVVLTACGHMSDLTAERQATRLKDAAVARGDYASAARHSLAAARTYTHPGDVGVQARLLGDAALWLAFDGREREALAALDECIQNTTMYNDPIWRDFCATQRREIRTRTGGYEKIPALQAISAPPSQAAAGLQPTPGAPVARTEGPRTPAGGTAFRAGVVDGAGPIPGSKLKRFTGENKTPAGHSIFGTERGLACVQRAAIQEDRVSELFELVCPVSVIGCYLTAPAGASPTDSGRCSIANSFPVSASRSESEPGRALLRLPLSGRTSVFVSAWNQCNWNSGLMLPMPDAWVAGCDLSITDLQAEIRNESARKLRQLHGQRWGSR